MDKFVDIGFGVKLFKDGLKDFDKESFLSYLKDNQQAGRIHQNVSPSKAWNAVKQYCKQAEKKKKK